MALIAASVVEEIKQLNIIDIITRYVNLTPRGNTFIGLCPFHMEKTPSFTVFKNRNNYKCYGCQSYGDSIKFIQDYMGLDFQNAVIYICENFNVELKYEDDGKQHKSLKYHKELHEKVALFAQEQLYSSAGKDALSYLINRGFSRDLLEYFNIGFLSPAVPFTSIIKDYSKDVISESGLFINTRSGLKSFFENRILFPLRSYTGAYIGFSGRTMDPAEKAKYKNSPETALFSKRRELFNLHNAKDAMQKHKNCYIVEGYFDVMRMVEAGYEQTVAIMGTAFTKEQVNKLKSYVEEYNIILDGDSAGQKAMRDSLSVALETNVYPYVAFLPAGEDPDTYIKSEGKENFNKLLSNKQDLLLYTIKSARESSTDDNKRFHRLDSIKQMLEKVGNVYRKQFYAEETAKIFGVNDTTLTGELQKIERPVVRVIKSSGKFDHICEKDFLCTLFHLPDESGFKLLMDMVPEHFNDDISVELFKKMVELFSQHGSISTLINEQDLKQEFLEILSREITADDIYKVAVGNKIKIILNYTTKAYHSMQKKILAEKDPSVKAELVKEWQVLLQRINQLKSQL